MPLSIVEGDGRIAVPLRVVLHDHVIIGRNRDASRRDPGLI
jgi:hypothetical protein